MKAGKNLILINTQILKIKNFFKFFFSIYLLKQFDSLKSRPSDKINFGGHMGAMTYFIDR